MALSPSSTDTRKITYFKPLVDESPKKGFFQSVLRLFSAAPAKQTSTETLTNASTEKIRRPVDLNLSTANNENSFVTPGNEVEVGLRNLSSIFKDIPRMMKPKIGENSSSTAKLVEPINLRRYWMPDDQCHVCYECNDKFTTFKRRHHCRICGHVFCSRCCNRLVSGKFMGYPDKLRSCIYCSEVVLAYTLQKNDETLRRPSIEERKMVLKSQSFPDFKMTVDPDHFQEQPNMKMLKQPSSQFSSSVFPSSTRAASFSISPEDLRFMDQTVPLRQTRQTIASPSFEGYDHRDLFDETPTKSVFNQQISLFNPLSLQLVLDSSQLRSLWREMTLDGSGLEFREHRFRLRKYSLCITGQELVEWLIRNEKILDRSQATGIGQALIDGKWLLPVTDHIFQDKYILYQKNEEMVPLTSESLDFTDAGLLSSPAKPVLPDHDPKWVRDINYDSYTESDPGFEDRFIRNNHLWLDASELSEGDVSCSEKSVTSTSYVVIDERIDVCKYTKGKTVSTSSKETHETRQPAFMDNSNTSISADFLRSFMNWHGTYLNQAHIPPSVDWRDQLLHSAQIPSNKKRAYNWLREKYLKHNLKFLRQLLESKQVDISWADVIIPLAKQAVDSISPDPQVDMSITYFVKVKKMSAESSSSQFVKGVVFTKNVVHKQMKTEINIPKIMIIAFPLEYQRARMKLTTIEPIVLQERDFFRHLVSRITARSPDIVLVGSTVSRIVQEYLLQADVTLIINVKEQVMSRVARCTEGDIIYSIDKINQARLGNCGKFYVKRHLTLNGHSSTVDSSGKTLVYFDHCRPIHGCTILLRQPKSYMNEDHSGVATNEQLITVKKILNFVIEMMYSAKLEISYLMDLQNFSNCIEFTKQIESSESPMLDVVKNVNKSSDELFTQPLLDQSLKKDDAHLSRSLPSVQDVAVNSFFKSPNDFNNSGTKTDQTQAFPKLLPLKNYEFRNPSKFTKALQSCLVCTSPIVSIKLPYLLSQDGITSTLHYYLPEHVFWSEKLKAKNKDYKLFRSRSSTMDSLAKDKQWMNPQITDQSLNHSTDVSHIAQSSNEHSMIVQPSNNDDTFSCYNQEFKEHRRNESSDSILSGKLQKWEKLIMHKVFEDAPTHSSDTHLIKEKEQKLQLITDTSPDHSNNSFQYISHNFIKNPLSMPAHSQPVIDMLAKFRSNFHEEVCPHVNLLQCENIKEHLARVVEGDEFSPEFVDESEEYCESMFDEDMETSLCESQLPLDCFDPGNHQHISALFSSHSAFSPNFPFFCVPPWVVDIDFYFGNDITLGRFLERYCFRQSYNCPNVTCQKPMLEHVRSFVYGNKCLHIVLKEISKSYSFTSIVTWNWDPITQQSTDMHALSRDSWSLSFAKFLELRLSNLQMDDCGVAIEQFDSHQYFMFRDIVAAFKCVSASPYEINFPEVTLPSTGCLSRYEMLDDACCHDNCSFQSVMSQMKKLSQMVYKVLDEISDLLNELRSNRSNMSESPSKEATMCRQTHFDKLTQELQDDKYLLRNNIDSAQLKLQEMHLSYSKDDSAHRPIDDVNGLNMTIGDADDQEFNNLDCEMKLTTDQISTSTTDMLELRCMVCELVQKWNDKLDAVVMKDRSLQWCDQKNDINVNSKEDLLATLESSPRNMLSVPENPDVFSDLSPSASPNQLEVKTPCPSKRSDILKPDRSRRFSKPLSTGSSVKSFIVNRILSSSNMTRSILCPHPLDHHYLPECRKNLIIVRDNECSSIIAYSLSSQNYKTALEKTAEVEKDLLEEAEDAPKPDTESVMNPPPKSKLEDHIELQFSDHSTKFYCKIYFAQLFYNFRKKVLQDGEDQYITSLCRSVKWAARGGKSGLNFHKTRDEQFILKQMSRLELQSFLDFAPSYVKYMTSQFDEKDPTVLSKILGIYRISFHNSDTGKSLKQDVLVIENLFYKKKTSQIFDLKGSVRNRHVKEETTETENSMSVEGSSVLQDENLLNMMSERPLYVHAHTKYLLQKAIQQDSAFLSKHLIMDYSLLVGVNDDTGQIYVGIIDYIRTFTWDKKLEMVVKSSYGILSSHKQSVRSMPTVVSPDIYKSRFCDAMEKYFLILPDRWHGMQAYL